MSANRQPAIHYQICPRNELRAVRGEEQRGLADIAGHSSPPQRVQIGGLLRNSLGIGRVAQVLLPKPRVDIARADAVYPDSPACEFQREIAGQRNHTCFGTRVRDGARERVGGMDRADVYDGAARCREQWNRGLRQQERAAQIYLHDPVPVIEGQALQGFLDLNASIVDEHVEPAVNALHRGDGLLDLTCLTEIGFDKAHWQ